MRSPVIAFGIVAAAAVSPTLVNGAPTSPNLSSDVSHPVESDMRISARQLPGLAGLGLGNNGRLVARQLPPFTQLSGTSSPAGALPVVGPVAGGLLAAAPVPAASHKSNQNDAASRMEAEAEAHGKPKNNKAGMSKRAQDWGTAGGNSYSGAAGSASGGSVVQSAGGANAAAAAAAVAAGATTDITNSAGANVGGGGGDSFSGFADGGAGGGHGPGGNAYSGATGPTRGGSVVNDDSAGDATTGIAGITNGAGANTAGVGGTSMSGNAHGGNAGSNDDFFFLDTIQKRSFNKRAQDWGTAGGNAYTGATFSASGGSVVNSANEEGFILNTAPANAAGVAGTSMSGTAVGGSGDGFGPGGNSYSGSSGPSRGGSVVNSAGVVVNAAGAAGTAGPNVAGAGGTAQTGDSIGGNADSNDDDLFDDSFNGDGDLLDG
ncbi:hypothetical protein OBBRIDRAFT_883120 [Obba rivulosa]|uniref:Uncharacterized protein n=1 Tax=Obba rivulosa TaxID=1052685 RepID=A0A8E2J7M3_9APHY|nr:hypothetical protein OBBRIDRAFT_883120 [Obba rivulosa]